MSLFLGGFFTTTTDIANVNTRIYFEHLMEKYTDVTEQSIHLRDVAVYMRLGQASPNDFANEVKEFAQAANITDPDFCSVMQHAFVTASKKQEEQKYSRAPQCCTTCQEVPAGRNKQSRKKNISATKWLQEGFVRKNVHAAFQQALSAANKVRIERNTVRNAFVFMVNYLFKTKFDMTDFAAFLVELKNNNEKISDACVVSLIDSVRKDQGIVVNRGTRVQRSRKSSAEQPATHTAMNAATDA